jgi:uncharacterized protein (DUF1015 family)
VADVRPFRALVYDEAAAGPLAQLVAPPYDVIDAEHRARLLASGPYNAIRLILPEVPYEQVAGLVEEWRAAGVLRRAETPGLIAWTQAFTGPDGVPRERRTLLAAVALEPYERRVVRPHERTHAGPKEDRLRLTRAVRANLSPVFGLYPDPAGAVWEAAGVDGPSAAAFVDAEGVAHRLWPVEDPAAAAAVAEAMRERWILIADGHHRYETALAYQAERRAAGAGVGPHDRVLMGLTALDDPGLVVLPTHRVLRRWPEDAAEGLAAAPAADLPALLAALDAAPPDRAALGLVRPDGMALLTAPRPAGSPADRLDVRVIEELILRRRLGGDQAALGADGTLSYVKDAEEAAGRVRVGEAAAALLLRPIAKADVAAVAESGGVMPPKSTYFSPKLLTGVAFHPLVDGA